MALITCPECTQQVSSMAASCPHCGYPIISKPIPVPAPKKGKSAGRGAKHPKLPNGFGSIKNLGGRRTNPYAVYPPTTSFTENGVPITQPAICYAPDWYTAFYALQSWKNGTFDPDSFKEMTIRDTDTEYDIVSKILAAYNASKRTAKSSLRFSEVYEMFFEWKYVSSKKKLSESTKRCTISGYKNCSALHDRIFVDITASDMQTIINDCPLKHASKEHILNLFRQMYSYAMMENICDKDYASFVKIDTPDDDESGVPFSIDELDRIWDSSPCDAILQGILIMCYSGYRIAAYHNMHIDFERRVFTGGVKNDYSRKRSVPFSPLIESFIDSDMDLFASPASAFRLSFSIALSRIGITGHTPHDCRHTFSWLCDHYNVDPLSKRLMLGHTPGKDTTDNKYGHRTLAELRAEIEKIKHW